MPRHSPSAREPPLLFSANRFERNAHIRKRLSEGYIVVLDRYILSGLVYSSASGLPAKWCARSDEGLPWPDLTIFLDVDVTSKRAGFGDEALETIQFQWTVYRKYKDMIGYLRTYAHTFPPAESHIGIGGIQMLDVAGKSIEDINHKQVLEMTTKCLTAVRVHNAHQATDKTKKAEYIVHDFKIDF